MDRYKLGDIDNEQFYMVPKGLFVNDLYKPMSVTAKVIYALLKDRMELSRKNGWHDDNGDIFFLFEQDELAELLCVNRTTIIRLMNELKKFDLIETVRQGLTRPNKLYIKKLQYATSESCKSQHQEVEKCNSSNTDTSNTDISKRNIKENPLQVYTKNEKLLSALNDFVDMRKKIRAPMTARAIQLMLNNLDKLSNTDDGKIAILNQSIMNSWKGLFPIKNQPQKQSQPAQPKRIMFGTPEWQEQERLREIQVQKEFQEAKKQEQAWDEHLKNAHKDVDRRGLI